MASVTPTALVPADTPLALQPLRELPLPAPVSYAPQTIGWAFVGVLLLALAAVAVLLVWRRYQRRRYRRAALAELKRIEAELGDAGRRSAALMAIPVLLKRTALAAAPRERSAALTGEAWLAFLRETRGSFDAGSGALLQVISYAPADRVAAVTTDEAALLVAHAREWITRHHVDI